MVGENRALRPFWLHQVVEYILGIVLISAAFQSPEPAVASVLGVVIMVNAAITEGPGGAFRLVHRKVHRVLDVVVFGLLVAGAVQPFFGIDLTSRVLLAAIAVVLGFVWWHTDFATKDERKARRRGMARPSSEEIGRRAGRVVGDGVNAARRLKDRE
jgi:hypothetical protein